MSHNSELARLSWAVLLYMVLYGATFIWRLSGARIPKMAGSHG